MSIQTLADIPSRAITARGNQLLTWLAAVKVAAEAQLTRRFWPRTAPAPAAGCRMVPYALAQLDDLLAAPDLLTTPAWRLLPANPDQADLADQSLVTLAHG